MLLFIKEKTAEKEERNGYKMNEKLLAFLFERKILVSNEGSEHPFETLFTLANKFGIKIVKGRPLVNEALFPFIQKMLGIKVPQPFYVGFPKSVKSLTRDQLLFDQLYTYYNTYYLGDFSEERHSVFEDDFKRIAFKEYVTPKEFVIVDEKEAYEMLVESVESFLQNTRPMAKEHYEVLCAFIDEYKYKINNCACKDTAIKLLLRERNLYFSRFISLADVVRVVDYINYYEYNNENVKKLNLKNRDRVFISKLISKIFARGRVNIAECFEKKANWSGILHHIHHKPKTDDEAKFVSLMRGKENHSVYSHFERAIAEGDIKRAVDIILEGKGQGGYARELNYLLSRAETKEDLDYIIEKTPDANPTVLLQLLFEYSCYEEEDKERVFKFSKFNLLKVHTETEEEMDRRRSYITKDIADRLAKVVREKLKEKLSGRIGKLYVDENMKSRAVPISESTTLTGLGVLPKGSRIPLPKGKKIRAFTYWEKVNDIDMSIMGIGNGSHVEFSWRSMSHLPQDVITWSGDVVSGYDGGAEYYDLNLAKIRKMFPSVRYLVFCNNVYSGIEFSKCFCRAGYMLRDEEDSGEIYEYKTVQSSFEINCDSTFVYMFAIDVKTEEIVWLNVARDSESRVAGLYSAEFLIEYLEATKVINLADIFSYMATEIVTDPTLADLVLSDEIFELPEGVTQLHSYETEKIMKLLK